MATVKFILSKSQHQRKVQGNSSMIMLRYTHDKKTVLFYTHKNIEDHYWDCNLQCTKKAYPSCQSFNIYLSTFKQRIENIINQCMINNQEPNALLVKQLYLQQQKNVVKTSISFFDYCNHFIEQSKKHKSIQSIRSYNTIVKKLLQYQKYANVSLHWNSFDLSFYYDFLDFYTQVQGNHTNGFGTMIRVLKVILNDAFENNIHQNTTYKQSKFKAITEEVNNIYLNEEELQSIIDLDLSLQPTLQLVRDTFIVGCYTGLRFSDLSRINKENIKENCIKIKTQKTNQWVSIPILKPVNDILKKYNGFPFISQRETMNKYLKKVGYMAGINEQVIKVRSKGKTRIEQAFSKYQLITTHTARRSFATNMFKRGVPPKIIMKITGHQTEKSFNSYIKINNDENAELLLSYLSDDIL